MSHGDDDDFDWEAAAAEIENAEKSGLLQSRFLNEQQARVPRQKTIESFFGGRGNAPPAPAAAPQVPRYPDDQLTSEDSASRVPIDPAAARTWIYPANVPRRDYQFSITKTALFANTLVSLPTGLGKTLIAAVVMYNFYRWFPDGKIVFTAPSKPLVFQQIEACHNTVGIPQDLSIDMTGQISPAQRANLWICKRVFFVTPQVLEKDIKSGICPMKQMVCLVVDEAHRATGNYAYCVAVREIMASNVPLRILALTATPGSNQATIQDVVNNLNISCLEYRDEDDPDVSQYTHTRKLELIQVTMNADANNLKDMFVEVLRPIVHRLSNFRVFYHSKEVLRLGPFDFLDARDKFRRAPPADLPQGHYPDIETCFGLAITLAHILKLLFSHGIKPAFEMLQSKLQKGLLAKVMGRGDKLHQIKMLMQQSISHGAPSPKLEKMGEILLAHFRDHDSGSTRVIIFTNYRDSVKDIMESLAKLDGPVNAMEFIGQSGGAGAGKSLKGQSQKVQQAVLQKFRNGGYNTIVATSIGEEGLDIMEVDLVICFDANISPLRMIQRMGRTGRKRDGRVVVLASEGAETQGYLSKQAKGRAVGKHMRNGGVSSFNFHPSPRMVPHAYKPEVEVVQLTIEQFVPRGRKNKVDVQAPLLPGASSLTDEEVSILDKYYRSAEEPWTPSLIAFPHYQLFPTPIQSVKHSSRTTGMLIEVLQGLRGLPHLQTDEEVFQQRDEGLQEDNIPDNADDEVPSSPSSPFVLSGPPSPVRSNPISPSTNLLPTSPVTNLQDPINSSPDFPVDNIQPDSPIARDGETILAAASNHLCFFSTGYVSVSDSGHVVISSPPLLRRRQLLEECNRTPDISVCNSDDEIVLETPETAKNCKTMSMQAAQMDLADTTENISQSRLLPRELSSMFKVPDVIPADAKPTEHVFVHAGTPSESLPARHKSSRGSGDRQAHSSQFSAVKRPQPLKRLRRGKATPVKATKRVKPGKGERMQSAQQFIDDEAEVSTDAEVSVDTDDEDEASEGFIDDNLPSNPHGSLDIYRKSLLTPSPSDVAPWLPPKRTSGSIDTGRSSDETASLERSIALDSGLKSVSITRQPPERGEKPALIISEERTEPVVPTLDMRKRKLSFAQDDSCDDLFDGLDLDALEAEAAQKCRQRAAATQNQTDSSQKIALQTDVDVQSSPSFDLGI